MDNITKNNSLETAKNRLKIDGLTYLDDNKRYVNDRIVTDGVDNVLKEYIPFIESNNGYILRYKNLMRQYYWLLNKFIPSCSYDKLCLRNGEKKWIHYNDTNKIFNETFTFNSFSDNKIVSTIAVPKNSKVSKFIPEKNGYVFEGWYTEPEGEVEFDFEDTEITGNTNVYAKYNIEQIDVTFVLNNGQEPITITVDYGYEDPSDMIAEPEKDGYSFDKWIPNIVPAVENATYSAVYIPEIYVIRFFDIINPIDVIDNIEEQPIMSGGTLDSTKYKLVKTETFKYGESSQYYQNHPIYTNFVSLDKWIDENGNIINNSEFTYITHDIDAYPKLIKKEYSVAFLDWDNSLIETSSGFTENPQIVPYLDDAIPPTIEPTREHYIFESWDRSYTGITRDTTIHAQYIGTNLLTRFLLPNEDETGYLLFYSANTPYNRTIQKIEPPKIEEYDPYVYGIFDGWYYDNVGILEEWDFSETITSNTVLYGKWKKEFNVYFLNWDKTLITGSTETFENPVIVGYGEDVPDESLNEIIYALEEKPGYEFLGWNKTTTGITQDTNITAVFSDERICVVNFINSIDNSIISSITVDYGSQILQSNYPEAPDVDNYTFNSWSGDTRVITRNVNVYAIYNLVDLTIIFIDYNGNILTRTTVKYGSTGVTPDVYVPDLEARLDFDTNPEILSLIRFDGNFCYVEDENSCIRPEEMIITENNTTFSASYYVVSSGITTYTLRLYLNNDYYLDYKDIPYGKVIDEEFAGEIMQRIQEEGYARDENIYKFYCFRDSENNEYFLDRNNKIITNNTTLWIIYEFRKHIVKFYVQDDPTYYPEDINLPIPSLETEVLHNKAIDRPNCENVPEKIYFQTFCDNGNNIWYKDSACTEEWIFYRNIQGTIVQNSDKVIEDTILYGKYIGNIYTLTFNTNIEGEAQTVLSFRYPEPTESISTPISPGKTFIGWYTDNGVFENEFVFGNSLNENIVLYAKWVDIPSERIIIYNASRDLRYSNNLNTVDGKGIIQEQCSWVPYTGDGVLVYSGELTSLSRSNFSDTYTYLYSITIPKSIRSLISGSESHSLFSYEGSVLREINVDERNTFLSSIDGVLFTYNKTTLLSYPIAKTDKEYIIPETVSMINIEAFQYSRYLKNVVIPNNIQTIVQKAFSDCSTLEKITIGNNCNTINSKAFANCISLKEIKCNSITVPSTASRTFENTPRTAKLYVPCQSTDLYASNSEWGGFDIQCFGTILHLSNNTTVVIYDDVLTYQGISQYRNSLTSVEIGKNVTRIDGSAFQECYLLEELEIPDNVISIGKYAFLNCTSLTRVNFGNGIKHIGLASFKGCNSLTELYLPYNIEEIENQAFSDSQSLRIVNCDRLVPPILTGNIFVNCNLTNIYVPCESVEDYKNASYWSVYIDIITCHQT